MAGRSDYAASGGDSCYGDCQHRRSPDRSRPATPRRRASGVRYQGYYTTGVVYLRSKVKMSDIKDGASNTYLAGEKYLNPDHYLDGNSGQRQLGLGHRLGQRHNTLERQGRLDRPKRQGPRGPGSVCRSKTPPALKCTGVRQRPCRRLQHGLLRRVRSARSAIRSTSETHHRLGNIADGLPIDAKAF